MAGMLGASRRSGPLSRRAFFARWMDAWTSEPLRNRSLAILARGGRFAPYSKSFMRTTISWGFTLPSYIRDSRIANGVSPPRPCAYSLAQRGAKTISPAPRKALGPFRQGFARGPNRRLESLRETGLGNP